MECHKIANTVHAGVWRASGLALLEVSPVRLLLAQWGLLETWMWVNIQRVTRAPHCAHVVWPVYGRSGCQGMVELLSEQQRQMHASIRLLYESLSGVRALMTSARAHLG